MLSVIIGAAQLMEMKSKDMSPEFKSHLTLLLDTSKRAADLTAQLLAFARKGHYKVVTLDVHEVIRSVVKLVSHTFDKRIRVTERLNGRITTIKGDYAQLQNMLLNLALNARDAMPEGGTLTIETEAVGPAEESSAMSGGKVMPGSFLRVRVIDTGTGMEESVRARAFEPFFTTKGQGKGTGLGLASVYGTVKSHNGMIELDSAPGKGTTFTIFLPLAVKAEPVQAEVKKEPGKGAGRILVVEDEEDIRMVLRDILDSLGYGVVACKDGYEAIEFYQAHSGETDAVIVDMIMPRMNGYDCITALKKINPHAKILIASGYSVLSDTQKLITKGIAGFIQKPFHIEELSQMIAEILAK
jgi:CheY-like chemotaxis protein